MEEELSKGKIITEVTVAGQNFSWNTEEGNFNFQGEAAVLFWISSAMKSFFDTIEEVSGHESARIVLETTGFRQGIVVGDYFKSQNFSIKEVAEVLPNTYASAGWGKITVKSICQKENKAIIQMKDSWEYQINKAQGKEQYGTFIPGHFAGMLTGLYGMNIWYRVNKSQIEGEPYCEFEFFPSEQTIERNIHDLARKEQAQQIISLERLVDERTQELNELVKEISSPIIPVLEGIVVVPLLGKYDENRSEDLIQTTLFNLPKYRAEYLILDLTGLNKEISQYTIEFLNKLASSASLIGTQTILVGISPQLGIAITETNFNLSKFHCFTNLQYGIYFALSQQGRKIQ
ncbi:STAS domain-containing protein [Heyndrickxia acidicola]|uniref:STAS domain-containing protein n=1 Tax=Heyndrickxia acidicola TaxID=209389 RepID=A0ABU6MCJ5_9BACI|nr:STAS domain-containing protein [Heyndrickxia acidicola]MED1202388.1 STAS domain-containing protein [Heyndrickxia acidicola]